MWARNFPCSEWKQIFLMSQHAFYPTITSAVFVINCVLNSNKQTNKKLLHSEKKVFFVVDKIMTIMESIAILVDVTLWYWPLIGIFLPSLLCDAYCIRTQEQAWIKVYSKKYFGNSNLLFFARWISNHSLGGI